MAKIVFTPDPILTKKSLPVLKIDKKVKEFIEQLKKTLVESKNPKGVGLAAPQIGKLWRIFVAKEAENSPIKVFINPKIIWKSRELTKETLPVNSQKTKGPRQFLEGCLSIPGIWGVVKRHQALKLSYQTLTRKINEEKISGFLSTIIQHEVDHLNGILFPARALTQKGKLYKIEKDKKGENLLVELEI